MKYTIFACVRTDFLKCHSKTAQGKFFFHSQSRVVQLFVCGANLRMFFTQKKSRKLFYCTEELKNQWKMSIINFITSPVNVSLRKCN